MANSSFTPVTFTGGQILDEDSLQQLSNNVKNVRDESTDGVYSHLSGSTTSTGLKFLTGRIVVPQQHRSTIDVRVPFIRFFSTTSSPNVFTSITSSGQNDFNMVIRGIGQIHPSHQGFIANIKTANVKSNVKFNKFYLNWVAFGF